MIDCSKLIKEGICKADCCGVVTFTNEFLKMHRDKFQQQVVQWINKSEVEGTIITKNGTCIFLTKDFKCSIYEERPEICKLFGTGSGIKGEEEVLLFCPYAKPNGNPWSEGKKKRILRQVNHKFQRLMRRFEK